MDQSSPNRQPAAATLRLATAPVNWNNNDLPGWRPHTPFPDIFDLMQEAGYDATEYDPSFGEEPVALRNEADAWDMTWCGCYQWVDFLDTANIDEAVTALERRLGLLAAIDCGHLIVADALRPHRVALAGRVPDDGSASLTDRDVATLADGVHRLAAKARTCDIAVHYHNHVGSWIEASHEVEALLRHLDPSLVDLCFDTGHYAYGGGNPAAFIARNHDRIGYLHLKDVDTAIVAQARAEGLTFLDALTRYVFSPIGTGSADIPAILHTLVSSGFAGWVVVEQDTCAGDPTETARKNRLFIESWLAEHAPSAVNGR